MRTKAKRITTETAFWDTSGLIPLLCFQPQSAKSRQAARVYSRQVVWWATIVEAVGSLSRGLRRGHLSRVETNQAFARLEYMRRHWNEQQPNDHLREQAQRLLRTHDLRAADAMQLAAALAWCSHRPRGRCFIGADNKLSEAAEAEGFTVIRLL
ncbi:MAG TPA: PIN domain-containing protein [Pyrinomonadaceae bacterium]|nr:PIN domain-containing protein [Pyrinomonadaceae bacterium]